MPEMKRKRKILQSVILDMVNRFGYLGILILIAVENVFPPISPPMVILTFGGFLDNVYSAAPGGGCAGIYGGLTAWRAGAVRSRNPRQPGRACRAAREPADEASGVSGRGCLEDHCLVSEKGAAGCAARPMHSDHPKSHLGSGRHGGDEDAGISAIYHSREYGLESSSGWHRCSGRRCMGAGGRICEAICGCGFPYFNGGNRMLSGIPFI